MTEQEAVPESGGEARDWSRPILKTTTVAAQGPQLPLGTAQGKTVAVRTWRLKEERVLGVRREEEDKRNMGKYVSIILATMCTSLGGHNWDGPIPEKDTAERELVVGQMWMPDVFYAYVWLRIQAMGKELPMTVTCPKCPGKSEFDWVGDLTTIEVKCPESLEDAMWHYKLHVPITIRGKEVTMFVMGPPRWHHVENVTDTSMGGAKSKVIHAHLHRIPELQEGEVALAESEMDELVKRDIEGLADAINNNGFGPRMSVDCKCPKGHTINEAIDWRFDTFFGISSPSPA